MKTIFISLFISIFFIGCGSDISSSANQAPASTQGSSISNPVSPTEDTTTTGGTTTGSTTGSSTTTGSTPSSDTSSQDTTTTTSSGASSGIVTSGTGGVPPSIPTSLL